MGWISYNSKSKRVAISIRAAKSDTLCRVFIRADGLIVCDRRRVVVIDDSQGLGRIRASGRRPRERNEREGESFVKGFVIGVVDDGKQNRFIRSIAGGPGHEEIPV